MKTSKVRYIIELLIVFIVFSLIFRWIAFYTRELGLYFMISNLILTIWGVGIPILLIWMTKTNAGFKKWNIGIHGGFLVFWLGFVQSIGFGSVDMLGLEFSSFPAMIIMIGFVSIMIVAAYFLLINVDESKEYKNKWKLVFFLSLYLIPPIVAWVSDKSIFKMIFWQCYFTVGIGFGEEVFYRGYIQTRLNDKLGKPWRIGKLEFGPGLLIASVLFGLSHTYTLGSTTPQIHFAIAAIFAGLFFGIVRERAGLWAAISFHVLWSAIPEPIMIAFGMM